MPNQHTQWGLPTLLTLAAGWAFAVTMMPSPADGYPGGSTVSTGSNPVVAAGGRLAYSGETNTVFTAPSDQNIVVTDVVLTGATTTYDCRGQSRVIISSDSVTTLASFTVDQRGHGSSSTGSISANYTSGLPVLAGESLYIRTEGNFQSCGTAYHHVDYSLAGYHAQP